MIQKFETIAIRTQLQQSLNKAILPNTRLVFVETPANPTLDIINIKWLAVLSHQKSADETGRQFNFLHLKSRGKPGRTIFKHFDIAFTYRQFGRHKKHRNPSRIATHSKLTAEQQLQAGISPGLVQLSVGLEHFDDIIADIE